MVRVYYDSDADLAFLKNRTVAVLGYGNQGRSQALNMRDSGVNVIVGTMKDWSWNRAERDGFQVYSLKKAAELGDTLLMLMPDEVQPEVYRKSVEKNLQEGDVLDFAHGFSIRYELIKPPSYVDVILVAPRMIGVGVRELYVKGSGAPAFVGVRQNSSGKAKEITLAIAKALGFTRVGVVESTFAEETELDLFSEQAIWSAIGGIFRTGFEVLVEAGYSPEAIVLEMLSSGEIAEVAKEIVKTGFFKQLPLHSKTSQYGQLSRSPRLVTHATRRKMKKIIEEIRENSFAREWAAEQKRGYPKFNRLFKESQGHPINQAEENIKKLMRIRYDLLF